MEENQPLIIIGLDAADPAYIQGSDKLGNLKQVENGWTDNGSCLLQGKAVSPSMWTSFMTGLKPSEHGVYGFDWDFPFSDWIYRLPTPNIGLENVLSKFLLKTGREKDFPGPDSINASTFIDQLGDRMLTVNAPLYEFSFNRKGDRLAAMGRHKQDLTHKELLENLRVHSELVHDEVMETLLQDNDRVWDVFFCYYYWLDGVQHRFYMNPDIIETEYDRADFYVGEIKEVAPDDAVILVVSDHGADGKGGHRDSHGFWSCNQEDVVPENPGFTDFYNLIMKYTGLPTRNDEENIRGRLDELGYPTGNL